MVKIEFVVSKEEDLKNWLKFTNKPSSYGINWFKDYPEKFRNSLISASDSKKIELITKYTKKFYSKKYLDLFYNANIKLNKYKDEIISKLEKIHKHKFPVDIVYIKYNTFVACPYQFRKNQKWFGIFIYKDYVDKYLLMVVIHELMHLFFHSYFWDFCKEKNLSESKIHDIKEAFTVIINEEFKDILKIKDNGYPKHYKLRKFILEEWKKDPNFKKVLNKVCILVKNNEI